MKIKILGSGGWEGIPAPFCNCKACKSAKEINSEDNRTRPEILVENKKGKFLVEISPDIRLQTTRFDLTNIDDFLISHWHFDHMYGLLELGAWGRLKRKQKMKLFCSQKTNDWLQKNFSHIDKEIIVVKPFENFKLNGISITPVPVYHMHSQDKDVEENQLNNTLGFVLQENDFKVVYLPDYFRIPKKSLGLIKNADLAIIDGTFLFEESFPSKPEQEGEKTDPDHLHGNRILEFAKSLKAKKVVFHSITHLAEKTHAELQKLLPEGMLISYDGMEFSF
jgi:phosphoribosyl 1,2-cyclic phosphate phosphodiesterase